MISADVAHHQLHERMATIRSSRVLMPARCASSTPALTGHRRRGYDLHLIARVRSPVKMVSAPARAVR